MLEDDDGLSPVDDGGSTVRVTTTAAQQRLPADQSAPRSRPSWDASLVDWKHIKEVANAVFVEKQIPEKHRTIDMASTCWAAEIPSVPGNHFYRGMVVRDPKVLGAILKDGVSPSHSPLARTFLADLACTALPYAFEPDHDVHLEKGLRVLFEFDRTMVPTRRSPNGYYETSSTIPPEAVTRVFLFNRALPSKFPFSMHAPSELLSLLS